MVSIGDIFVSGAGLNVSVNRYYFGIVIIEGLKMIGILNELALQMK